MRDMAHHHAEQLANRIVDHRFMKCRVTDARADRQCLSVAGQVIEAGNLVDVHEMRRLGEPESHDRDKALSTRQNSPSCGATLARIFSASSSVFGT